MNSLLQIGSDQLKEAAQPLADALVTILEANADQATIQKALEVFGVSMRISDITVRDSCFVNKQVNADG